MDKNTFPIIELSKHPLRPDRHISLQKASALHRGSFSNSYYISAAIALLGLLLWEGLVYIGQVSVLFFPPPTIIFHTLGNWIINGSLLPHLLATLRRVISGFILGAVAGLVLGLLMGWSKSLCRIADPFIAAAHPIPKIAILPLVMIVFGIGERSKIVLAAIGAFFPMLINTLSGVQQIQPLYFEVARNYGAGPFHLFCQIIIPGSLPTILTGARLAVNVSLLLTIAVELISAQQGLGALIWLAWETLRTEELYAGLFVTSILGIGMNAGLKMLARRLLPWQLQQE